jgi:alkyl sulfatase BDS1-like metallo-beta-lactamase superfamily hydrolase
MLKNIFNFFILLTITTLNLEVFSEPSSYTVESNQKVLQQLPFNNTQDFADATRGFIAPLLNQGIIKNSQGTVVWNLPLYNFVDTHLPIENSSSPSSVNPSLWRQLRLLNATGLFKVTKGIYQVRGADLANMTIVEGKTGLIIIDTLLSKETAQAALELYYQNRPKQPIKAVIYSHSHADHFGGVKGLISQEDVNQGKVKVIAPEGFTEAALDENVMAGNVMGRRALYMYGALIDPGVKGQASAGLGLTTSNGEMTLILPTDFVTKTGQEMIIDGIKFVFLMAPGSEAPSEMLFFLPEFKALGVAEDATHNMHNLYTLRGAKIRDAKAWAKYLNQAIEMFGPQTEVVFSQHHWPKWENSQVIDCLEKQRDMFKYIHDQTLRLANQGYTMVEIGERIKMPDSLAKEWYNRGYYGSLNHNAKSVYNFYLGWFSGNPSTLYVLPEVEAGKKYVAYMGGADAVLEKAQQDYDKGEYRWVAQVLNHLVFSDPQNQKAKNLLANTLDQLGYQAENATWRNFYLTGAQELRQGVQPRAILSPNSPDMIASMPIESFFDYLAIRLDGLKAAENPMKINFDLTDKNQQYLLEIKNGVLNYFPNKTNESADLTIALNRADFNALIMGQVKMEELVKSNKLALKGNPENLKKFQSLFDTFNPWFNIVEPQASTKKSAN